MRLFSVKKPYTTWLSYEEIISRLEDKKQADHPRELNVFNYSLKVIENTFYIKQKRINSDSQYFPQIKGEVVNLSPTQIRLSMRPSYGIYGIIVFLFFFALFFTYAGLFVDDWTMNGVKRPPTDIERVFIVLMASGIPLIMFYSIYIRPRRKAEQWIVKKLQLVNNLGNTRL
jgi:hypothetical protein